MKWNAFYKNLNISGLKPDLVTGFFQLAKKSTEKLLFLETLCQEGIRGGGELDIFKVYLQ